MGHEPRAGAVLRHRDHLDDAVHRVQDLIDDRRQWPVMLQAMDDWTTDGSASPSGGDSDGGYNCRGGTGH